jgi:hypothetical protein
MRAYEVLWLYKDALSLYHKPLCTLLPSLVPWSRHRER